ncbi:protein LURP-one-related 15-like [Vigna radiata var. radiata]|uniref:Protein LURP-one-related 15-like n=1 Tax=Vigna radiata var. radiata TaxID=3916 RepID=A0A1S3TSN9_VIGRR|nr:protein LURP-one-related 15-like [Vigna radiata var. radiata]
MANQLSPPFGTPITAPQYCAPGPHPVDLIIIKERSIADNFTVTDTNGNIVFTVKSNLVSIVKPRKHSFLFDSHGNPIVHLRRSIQNYDWKAFRGQSEESRDLIFRKHNSSFFQLRLKSDVFLANNVTDVCDFKIKSSWSGRSWDVYLGDSNILVAQINTKLGTMFSREKYMVSVFPNIDHAFIVALVLTLQR